MNKPDVHVETGGLNIIASGSGITFSEDADFNINLNFNELFNFSVCINFQKNLSAKEASFNVLTDTENNIVKISCINFNRFSGIGISKPLNIATYENKKIYIKFSVTTLSGNKSREVLYCFYMEKDNGNA